MSIFYPRKQTVVISLICIALVSIVAYRTYGRTPAASKHDILADPGPVATAAVDMEALSASTTPGIASDWRKQFIDASVSGAYPAPSGKAAAPVSPEPLTMTDKLGRDFFTRYIQLKQANLLSDQSVVDQTTGDLVTANVASVQPKTFTEKDLTITPVSNGTSLSTFSDAVARTVELYDAKESEATIMQDYMNTEDPSVLARLDPIIATYRKIISGLLSIPTPSSVSHDEVALVNSFSALEFSAEAMRATDTDSIRGISGVSAHVNGLTQLIDSLFAIQSDLQRQGATFVLNNEDAFAILLN